MTIPLATVYPGGLTSLGLIIASAVFGLVSLLLLGGAVVSLRRVTFDRTRALVRTSQILMLCAVGAVLGSMTWIAFDELSARTPMPVAAERALADWAYGVALSALYIAELGLGRLLQRRLSKHADFPVSGGSR